LGALISCPRGNPDGSKKLSFEMYGKQKSPKCVQQCQIKIRVICDGWKVLFNASLTRSGVLLMKGKLTDDSSFVQLQSSNISKNVRCIAGLVSKPIQCCP
jgi:hypothetical protein